MSVYTIIAGCPAPGCHHGEKPLEAKAFEKEVGLGIDPLEGPDRKEPKAVCWYAV